jgi:predicted ABC-class ATPase
VKPLRQLRAELLALDGRGYKAYKSAEGLYRDPDVDFALDHAQGDPFADPSRVRVELTATQAGFPAWAWSTRDRRRATADFLNRTFHARARRATRSLGSGRSGDILVLRPGQEVLARTSVEVASDGAVTARFRIGLPARGRRILGRAAADLVDAAVNAARGALFHHALDQDGLRLHVETVEDAVALRAQLDLEGLVAFVADGAILPRRSGVDDRPLLGAAVVPFASPPSLRRTLRAPNAGPVPGMAIPIGITLIAGGGYHGKSTLLRALERGIYDHVPGDGRERVVTLPTAAKVRAEDGRRVAGVDISNFIAGLPDGSDTTNFDTENASGSTSQAAHIVESLEAGARVLLLDEDTSATNFMIRDARMQRLVASRDEPITPFIDRARPLFEEEGVSTILVVGGSGDYFDIADHVLVMRGYRPQELTAEARRIARDLPGARLPVREPWRPLSPRLLEPTTLDPASRGRPALIRIHSRDRVQYGEERVELGGLEQLVEVAQTRAIAYTLARVHESGRKGEGKPAPRRPLALVVREALHEIEASGLAAVHPHEIGELAWFRPIELAGFLNRLRSVRVAGGADEPA